MDTTKTLSSSATRFLSGTFLSRVTGMIRDITMAYTFGATSLIAAFMIAYRFAHLMRRLFGESPLSGSFIPHFERQRQADPEHGGKFFLEFFFSLALALLCVIGVGELLLAGTLPFFHGETGQIVRWTMIMLPGLFFICLFGLSSSFLQCHRVFFLPGVAPAAFNLVWICAAILAYKKSYSVTFLAMAVVIGLFMQLVMIWPKVTAFIKQNVSLYSICACRPFSAEVKKAILPFALGIIGIAASQFNAAIDTVFARFASPEGPAYLWYAIRIQQIPIAFVGVAYASALLPSLARADDERYASLLSFALSRSYTLCFSMMMMIFSLGIFGINFVYGRGQFTTDVTYNVTSCLWAYSLGLIPMVFTILLVVAYQSVKEFKTPTKIAFWTVLVNIFLNSIMVFVLHLGAISVALATSISSLFQVICLHYFFPRKDAHFFPLGRFVKVGFVAIFAAGITIVIGQLYLGGDGFFAVLSRDLSLARSFPQQLAQFFSHVSVFLISLFALGYLFNIEEVRGLVKKIRPKALE